MACKTSSKHATKAIAHIILKQENNEMPFGKDWFKYFVVGTEFQRNGELMKNELIVRR